MPRCCKGVHLCTITHHNPKRTLCRLPSPVYNFVPSIQPPQSSYTGEEHRSYTIKNASNLVIRSYSFCIRDATRSFFTVYFGNKREMTATKQVTQGLFSAFVFEVCLVVHFCFQEILRRDASRNVKASCAPFQCEESSFLFFFSTQKRFRFFGPLSTVPRRVP